MDEAWTVSDAEIEEFMKEAIRLVKECGDIIALAINSQQNVEINQKEKVASEGHGSAVLTETDMKVEQHLIKGLQQKFPDHRFIGEENVSNDGLIKEYTNAPTWIIDPIDGTMNFIHSNPLVCTSIGLTINKKLVAGIVNCPMIGKMYTAIKGKGAMLNGETALKVSGVKELSKAMVIMELPAGANKEKQSVALANLGQVMERAHAVRCPGPATLDIAWVGAGAADCFFMFGECLSVRVRVRFRWLHIIHNSSTSRYSLLGHGGWGAHRFGGWRRCVGPIRWRVRLDEQVIPCQLYRTLLFFIIHFSRDILVCSSQQLSEQILGFLKIYRTGRDFEQKFSYF